MKFADLLLILCYLNGFIQDRCENLLKVLLPFSGDDIKPCPRCQVLIVKMDDGSCNHMMCAVCGAEFCWLCMKEISDLHYLRYKGVKKISNSFLIIFCF